MFRNKGPDDARKFVEQLARFRGWELHPDDRFLNDIIRGLATNYNRYGYYLCPCRDGDGERAADADIICPCDYLEADHQEYGHCFCGLFLRPGFRETGVETEQIPERRTTTV